MGKTNTRAEETIELPAEAASAAKARQFVKGLVRESGHESLEDAAALCVSELVANVSRHTGSTVCVVTVRDAGSSVTIEVTDDESSSPEVAAESPPLDAVRGRGLQIVDALAGEWGVRDRPPAGKTVWLRLRQED